ncbi:hypothetical protein Zmor_019795 [Zophobas morio]|uniref:Putative nuclease HARBI1 n=1 Tax=Zophobas morio TaxID=2755281 RepID=A0AA38I0H8_9CUCU|nr:hypothetical protein Zmor_019795 [Zophobas morio]
MDELVQILEIEHLENLEGQVEHGRRLRRNPRNPFAELNERQFINMFRLTKQLTQYLINILQPFLTPPLRATDLNIQTKVLTALRFFASGSYQLDIGTNKYLDVSQPSVSRCVNEVASALNDPQIFNGYIKFPNNFEDLNRLRQGFYDKHGFPGVIGCIDCTHVAIFPPKSDDPSYPEHLYVNRKNYHSVNVQLICDSNLKILNVNAKFPGSTHDSYIWSRSNVQTFMQDLHSHDHKDYFLLGDSGYPLRTWILTPFSENVQPNSPEQNFNEIHKNTRVKIECCNGVLKMRFRCLLKHRVLHYTPPVCCKIINACAVLHNLCIEHNVPEPNEPLDAEVDFGVDDNGIEENEEIQNQNICRRINPDLADGKRKRLEIARRFMRRP